MKKLFLILSVSLFIVTGCATIINHTDQGISVNSTPNDAVVEIDGQEVGKTPWSGMVDRKEKMQVTIKKEGYNPKVVQLEGRMSGWLWGNIFSCGIFGSVTDAISGGAFEYALSAYHVALEPLDKVRIPNIESQSKLKRYILANWADIGAEVVSTPAERVDALKEIMGYPNKPLSDFAKMIKPDYLSSKNPDDFSEKMLLLSK